MLLPSILEDVEIVRSSGELTPHEKNTGVGHLQLGLRRHAPYVCADLASNPLIESVVAEILGGGAWLGFYNGNVNCPGSTFQPLHFDRPYSWKSRELAEADGQPWPPPTTTLSCSVALAEITAESGATEIYPGSQRETEVATWTTNRLKERPDLLEAWGPPARMEIRNQPHRGDRGGSSPWSRLRSGIRQSRWPGSASTPMSWTRGMASRATASRIERRWRATRQHVGRCGLSASRGL